MSPKKFILIGAGGVGSWLAEGLVRSLEYQAPGSTLIIVDGDTFEPKNMTRQNFSIMGNKADALRIQLDPKKYAKTYIVSVPAWVVPAESVNSAPADEEVEEGQTQARVCPADLFEDGCVVYCVVDNFSARKTVFDAAANYNNIDVFTGGNDDELYVTAYHYRRRNGEDITFPPGKFHAEFVSPPDKNPGELSCAERAQLDGGTQFLAANLGVAAQLLAYTADWVFGSEAETTELENSEFCYDMRTGNAVPSNRTVASVNNNSFVAVN